MPPLNLIEEDEFTATITLPEDGDERNAASIEPAFQGLTNRTRRAHNRLNTLTDQLAGLLAEDQTWHGVHSYDQYVRSASTRTHRKLIPLSALYRFGGASALSTEDLYLYSGQVQVRAWLSDFIPHGATISRVRAQIRSTAAAGTAMSMLFFRLTHNMAGADGGPNVIGGNVKIESPGAGDHILDTSWVIAEVNDTSTFVLSFESNAAATYGDPDRIRWIEVEYQGYFPTLYL